MKLHSRTVFWFLLLASPVLISCQQAPLVGEVQDASPILFQLNDKKQSLVDAHLMHTTSYGTRTNRLLLPGFTSKEGWDIYRIRHEDQVFVFHKTGYGLFGERYRIEVFDLHGNLIKHGDFHCGENDVPITLIRVTTVEDDPNFPIYGVGLFNTHRQLTEQDIANAAAFGRDIDPDGDGFIVMPTDAGDLAYGTYLSIDYRRDDAYRREHGLEDHVRVSVSFFKFEGEDEPLSESIVRRRSDVFVECLEMDIPFYRFKNDQDGEPLPPFAPDRPSD